MFYHDPCSNVVVDIVGARIVGHEHQTPDTTKLELASLPNIRLLWSWSCS